MSAPAAEPTIRSRSYGQGGVSVVDRLGVYLSRRAIERNLGGRRGVVALDLGCGYHATLLRALRHRLSEGVGIDVRIAPEAHHVAGLSFVEASIEEALPLLDDASFDLILLTSVLEHLNDPLTVLEDCVRVGRPGSVVLINVPTWLGKAFLEFSAFRLGTSPAEEMDDHKMYYDKRDLWPLLVRAGFKPSAIRLKYHKFGLNLFAVARVPEKENRS
jgi:SAM-dependent methyltransferase